MIAKSYISQNLNRINSLFKKAKSVKSGLFYSKLAILELGGWIEMTLDDIILRLAKRRLRDPAALKAVKDFVKRNYGFDYDQHCKKMLIQVVGLSGVEKLEKRADGAKLQAMAAALNTLKQYRDQEAHEYMKGVTKTLDAPSVTKGRLVVIYDGLVEIDRVLKQL